MHTECLFSSLSFKLHAYIKKWKLSVTPRVRFWHSTTYQEDIFADCPTDCHQAKLLFYHVKGDRTQILDFLMLFHVNIYIALELVKALAIAGVLCVDWMFVLLEHKWMPPFLPLGNKEHCLSLSVLYFLSTISVWILYGDNKIGWIAHIPKWSASHIKEKKRSN